MRTIKYRAWMPNQARMAGWEEVKSILNALGWDNFTEGEKVLLEYTGLKDKLGTEIYEGDILLEDDKKHSKCRNKRYVVARGLDGMGACIGLMFDSLMEYPCNESKFLANGALDCVVIGNIYENPELAAKASESNTDE